MTYASLQEAGAPHWQGPERSHRRHRRSRLARSFGACVHDPRGCNARSEVRRESRRVDTRAVTSAAEGAVEGYLAALKDIKALT